MRILVLALGLAGCAAQMTPEQLDERYREMAAASSNEELCAAIILAPTYGKYMEVYAREEFEKRGGMKCDMEMAKAMATAYATKYSADRRSADHAADRTHETTQSLMETMMRH